MKGWLRVNIMDNGTHIERFVLGDYSSIVYFLSVLLIAAYLAEFSNLLLIRHQSALLEVVVVCCWDVANFSVDYIHGLTDVLRTIP